MEAEVSATLPAQGRTFSKRTAMTAVVVVAGMIFFAANQSMHGAPPPDSVGESAAVRPAATYSASAADVPIINGNGAAAPIRYGSLTFHGYVCTLDCSGHMAGYNYAKATGINRPGDCPNTPQFLHSLTEGCWAETGRPGH
jgi:hypothetical protein